MAPLFVHTRIQPFGEEREELVAATGVVFGGKRTIYSVARAHFLQEQREAQVPVV